MPYNYNTMDARFSFFLIFVVVAVHCRASLDLVHKMDINEDDVKAVLRNMHGLQKPNNYDSTPRLVQSFKWNTCRNNTMLDLRGLTVGPDPLSFPGDIYLSFNGTIKEDIDAPLKMKLTVKKEISPSFWLEIPCIDGIGSCDYNDLCESFSGATCPDPFVKYDVPCKCPFNKGSYKMKQSGFSVPVKVPDGHYYAKADVQYNSRPVVCFELYFQIQSSLH